MPPYVLGTEWSEGSVGALLDAGVLVPNLGDMKEVIERATQALPKELPWIQYSVKIQTRGTDRSISGSGLGQEGSMKTDSPRIKAKVFAALSKCSGAKTFEDGGYHGPSAWTSSSPGCHNVYTDDANTAVFPGDTCYFISLVEDGVLYRAFWREKDKVKYEMIKQLVFRK